MRTAGSLDESRHQRWSIFRALRGGGKVFARDALVDWGPIVTGTRREELGRAAAVRRPVTSVDGEWIGFEVVTLSGRAAGMRFRIRRDFVEIWRGERNLAVFDRDGLRNWLAAMPSTPYAVDDVVLSVDRSLDVGGDVAISLPDLKDWVLSGPTLAVLRKRVAR